MLSGAGIRALVVPAGDDASGRLRAVWPGLLLKEAGHDVAVTDLTYRFDARVDDEGHVREVAKPDCQVIVFQRLQNRLMVEAIPLMQAQGMAVVVDVDDAFNLIDPANIAFTASHPRRDADYSWHWLAEACKRADLVTVTTPALAAIYGAHGRVAVIPNRLPRQVLSIEHTDAERLRVGWAGSLSVHPNDLQVTRGAIGRVVRDCGLTFVNVGPGGAGALLGVPVECVTGWIHHREWFTAVAESIDIAVVPLADTKFNAAKSALSLLTHSSLGIPAVASPTPDNCRVHADGMGVLATKPKDWYRELQRLATDAGWRAEVAHRSKEAARAAVLEDFLHEWWEAWELARSHHQWRNG